MSLQIGTQLGSFQISSLIGKGGMGEVYQAKDTKLKRDVAIKILPDEFSRDTDRVATLSAGSGIISRTQSSKHCRDL